MKKLPSWKGSGTDGQGKGHEDVLVVPGDISSSLDRSAETLTELKERYDEVQERTRTQGGVCMGLNFSGRVLSVSSGGAR